MAHTTKVDREKAVYQTPESVRIREEAAARCTKVVERRVLKKQARKARADHLVKLYYDARTEDNEKTAVVLVVCQREVHGRQRRMAETLWRVLANPDETR